MKKFGMMTMMLVFLLVACFVAPVISIPAAGSDNDQTRFIIGDTDGDGIVSIFDATCIQRFLAQIPGQSCNELVADVEDDGSIDIFDVTMIQRYLADLITDSKIGTVLEQPTELSTVNRYTVIFEDDEGNVLDTQTVNENDSAVLPKAPEKNGYVFKGWDKAFDKITGDVTIKAIFEKLSDEPQFVVQTVYAKAEDKNVAVDVKVVNNPGIAAIALDIEYDKAALALKNFTYNDSALSGASTTPYSASAKIPCLYMVNGTQNITGDFSFATLYFDVLEGNTGKCPITVSYDEDNVYNLAEDNIAFGIVSGAIIIPGENAAESDGEVCTVTFKDYDGTVISTQKVEKGSSAVVPESPSRSGFVFVGWDVSFVNVQTDIIVTALYEELGDSPSFIIDKVSAQPGQKNVAVTVAVKNNPGVSAIALDILFDDSKLTLTGFTYNDSALSGASTTPYSASASTPCLFMVNGTKNITEDFVFATMFFDVSKDAAGTCPISVVYDPDNVYNIAEDNVTFEVVNGSIIVS